MKITRRNTVLAAAIVAAGITIPAIGLGFAHAAAPLEPAVVQYEDGSFTIDFHDGQGPVGGTKPGSRAAND